MLSELVGWNDERKRHACFACTPGTADSVCVGFGGCREVEVEDAGDILEVDTTRDTIILVFAGDLAPFIWESFLLVLFLASFVGVVLVLGCILVVGFLGLF